MKVGVIIGRFQSYPLHVGHLHLIESVIKQVDALLILVGSANRCRSITNPWTFRERKNHILEMVYPMLTDVVKPLVTVLPINDHMYDNEKWISEVNEVIHFYKDYMDVLDGSDHTVTIFGHQKHGNDYLQWFDHVNIDSEHNVCATDVRNNILSCEIKRADLMHENVVADYIYYRDETEKFGAYPYPETINFACSDAVVECNDHILLIKRKNAPGKDTWALPGGFKNRGETFQSCAIRELKEEANIWIPKDVLIQSIVKSKLYDDPKRSYGIPRHTVAYHIKLHFGYGTLPVVEPFDDAIDAQWIPIFDVMNNYQLHDDHSFIISELLNVYPVVAFMNPAISKL